MKQSQVHRKEVPSKEEIPFELNSLNQKLEVSRRSPSLYSEVCWGSGLDLQARGTQDGLLVHLQLQALSEFKNNYDL